MKKFCICLMMLCIIGVISGCCGTSTTASDEHDETSEKKFEFSDVESRRGLFCRIRIVKDNEYGNEYVIVESDKGMSICPRIRN